MRVSDWQRLSLLLDELTDLPAAEREARLAALPPELAAPLGRMLANLPANVPTVVAANASRATPGKVVDVHAPVAAS